MGEPGVDPDEQTMLSGAEDDTRSVTAWSLDDGDFEDVPHAQRFSPGVITVAAIVASLVVVIGAAVTVGYQLHEGPESAVVPPSESPTPSLIKETVPAAMPAPPATVIVQAPAPPPRQRSTGPTLYTTYISWVGTPCIQIRFPDGNSMPVETTCATSGTDTVQHQAVRGEVVGADPIMGQATELACRVMVDATNVTITYDSGTAGDGHDINCLVDAP